MGGVTTDIVSVPLFIVAICSITGGGRFLSSLGKNSTIMWFVHAVPLSTAPRFFFQSNCLWVNNPLLLFVVLTVSSYFLAIVINCLLRGIGNIA